MAFASSLLLPNSARATKFWKNSVTSGNWSNGNNWSAVSAAGADNGGVPVASEQTRIVNTDGVARTVTLDTNTPSLGLVAIDLTGAGTTANTLSIPNNNTMTVGAMAVGGHNGVTTTNGRGALTQANGSVTISSGLDLVVGWGAGSTGTYTLSGGSLTAPQSEFIGSSGTGTFNHSGGTNTILAGAIGYLNVGTSSGAMGNYNLSGTGQLISNKSEYIGDAGAGNFVQTGGSNTIVGTGNSLYLGYSTTNTSPTGGTYALSSGSLTVSGQMYVGYNKVGAFNQSGGTVNINGHTTEDLVISGAGSATGSFNQTGGTFHAEGLVKVGYTGLGSLVIDGQDSDFSALFIEIGQYGTGNMVVSGGASATFNLDVDLAFNGTAHVTVKDPGSLLQTNSYLVLGNGGVGTLDIQNQGVVSIGTDLIVHLNSAVNVIGGTLRLNSIDTGDMDRVNYSSGTIQLIGNRTVGSASGDAIVSHFFGGAPTIPIGKGLTVEGTATLLTSTVIDGGTFSVGQLANAANLGMNRGTFNLTNQALTIGAGGTFGSTLDINTGMTVNVTLGTTNQGLVTGDGEIGGTFTNAAAGELRGEPGKSLKLTGASNTNAGQINLLGGLVEYTQGLTNNAGGFISGNGTLKTNALTNSGTMNFSGLANIVGDVTNNAGGKIISSGGGPTTFFDDVTNNGEIRTTSGSFTVFYGAATGSGTYTGLGTVNFEGDLKPGNSPAAVHFDGDVVLGTASTLRMELGGSTVGSQYDQINVAGKLTLGGTLEITLINGFIPTLGQSFDLLNWGTVAGAFASLQLPSVPGLVWNTSQLSAGIVSIVAAGIPGDYNNNGVVDAADYVLWRENPSAYGGSPAGYNTWRTNIGQTAGSGTGSSLGFTDTSVPEPAGIVLLAVAAASLLGARKAFSMLRTAALACLVSLLVTSRLTFAGTVITANLPPNTAIVNIDAKQDGAATWNSGQDSWFHPFFTGGATGLLQYAIAPGTYQFRLTNPSLAATQFPALTAGQLSQIFTAWTYNSPWITDYFVFDSAGATNFSVPQIFAGAIRPSGLTGGTGSATEAFNLATTYEFDDVIVKQPGGRITGVRTTLYTFTAPETLTFAVPDNILSDNNGGISVVISQVAGVGVPGDYNNNGGVDAADYVLWRNGGPLANEVDAPGTVNAQDYMEWRNRFGNTSGSAALAGHSTVPEPGIGGLIFVLCVTLGIFNRTATRCDTLANEFGRKPMACHRQRIRKTTGRVLPSTPSKASPSVAAANSRLLKPTSNARSVFIVLDAERSLEF